MASDRRLSKTIACSWLQVNDKLLKIHDDMFQATMNLYQSLDFPFNF